jgi:hypothetical protein
VDFEPSGDPEENQDAHVPLARLKLRDIGWVEACSLGERFLGQSQTRSALPDGGTQRPQVLGLPPHDGVCCAPLYGRSIDYRLSRLD